MSAVSRAVIDAASSSGPARIGSRMRMCSMSPRRSQNMRMIGVPVAIASLAGPSGASAGRPKKVTRTLSERML
jgi:hypothetical protein